MRVLLDTHAFLWWINDDPKLSERAHDVMSNAENTLYLSAASGWEMAIKSRIGKLDLPKEPESFTVEELHHNRIQPLSISLSHALHTYGLPMLHRDLFDRILVALGQLENLPILTVDQAITQYTVKRFGNTPHGINPFEKKIQALPLLLTMGTQQGDVSAYSASTF